MRVSLLVVVLVFAVVADMVILVSVARSLVLDKERDHQMSVNQSENNKFKVKEGEVLVDVFVGNVTDLDDKRLVPTGSNPLHNR